MLQNREQLHHTEVLESQTALVAEYAERLDDAPIDSIDQLVGTINMAIGFNSSEIANFKEFGFKLAVARRQIIRKLETRELVQHDPDFVERSNEAIRSIDENRVRDLESLGTIDMFNQKDGNVYRCNTLAVADDPDMRELQVEKCKLLTRKDVGDILSREDFYFDDLSHYGREFAINEYLETHPLYVPLEVVESKKFSISKVLQSIDGQLDSRQDLRDEIEESLWSDGSEKEKVIMAHSSIESTLDTLSVVTGGFSVVQAKPSDPLPPALGRTIKVAPAAPTTVDRDELRERRQVMAARTHDRSDVATKHEREPDTLSGKIISLGKKAAEQVVEVFHRAA